MGGGGLFFALSSLTALNSRLGSLVVTASFTFNFVDWAEKEIGKKLQLLLYNSSSVRNLDTNLIIFITPRQREGLFLLPPNSSNVRKKNLKAQQTLELSWLCLSLTPHWLTDSLTNSCLVNLIDVTLACEDGNQKLVEVVTVVVDDEKQLITMRGHPQRSFGLWWRGCSRGRILSTTMVRAQAQLADLPAVFF